MDPTSRIKKYMHTRIRMQTKRTKGDCTSVVLFVLRRFLLSSCLKNTKKAMPFIKRAAELGDSTTQNDLTKV